MRIVAGKFRGRRLESPGTRRIRPTADRVREALFSILAARIPGARVLDLFAGTGALGLEALSRGAAEAVFVDQGTEALRVIRTNVQRLEVSDRVEVVHGSVTQAVRRLAQRQARFDLIFMDPPYGKGYIEITLPLLGELAHPHALLIAEHPVKEIPPRSCAEWQQIDTRTYGDTAVTFYAKGSSESPP